MPVRGSSEGADSGSVPSGSEPVDVAAGAATAGAATAGAPAADAVAGAPTTGAATAQAVDDDPGETIRLLVQALTVKVASLADGHVDGGDRWWFTPSTAVDGPGTVTDEPGTEGPSALAETG